jgi:hypothetical protein
MAWKTGFYGAPFALFILSDIPIDVNILKSTFKNSFR